MRDVSLRGRNGSKMAIAGEFSACSATQVEKQRQAQACSLWLIDTRIQYCAMCGRPIAILDQLEAFAASTGIHRDLFNICTDCQSTRVRSKAHDGCSFVQSIGEKHDPWGRETSPGRSIRCIDTTSS